MSCDHVEIGRLTEELRSLRSHLVGGSMGAEEERALRRILYGLSALVRVHFAKEEEVYLPLLDARLTAEEPGGVMARIMVPAARRAARPTDSRPPPL